jgi:hypothetical protein
MTKVLFKKWSEECSYESWAYWKYVLKNIVAWACLEEYGCASIHGYLQDIIIMKSEEMVRGLIKSKQWFEDWSSQSASSRWVSRRDHMLEAWHIFCDHRCVNICLKRGSPIVEYGEKFARLHLTSAMMKVVPSPSKYNQESCSIPSSRSSSSRSSGTCKEKDCPWYIFSFMLSRC